MAESTPLLEDKMNMEIPSPANASRSRGGKKPQAIAHRGYKAAHPENTMGAFKGAVEVGAHAIETDIHLSRDGVVVLSHDPTLKRCFGVEKKIADCDWSYLKTLKTLKEPQGQMPRLKDLLDYLATPGLEDIWVLLDIKLDNDPEDVFRLIASTLEDAKPSKPWNGRIVLGIWTAQCLPLCTKYLPGYPIMHIGFNISYARQFLKAPFVGFNLFAKTLVGPRGNSLLKDIRKAKRSIVVWTVNEEVWMKWSIKKAVDGVITDDPKKYLEFCDDYDGGDIHFSLWTWFTIILFNLGGMLGSLLLRRKYGFGIEGKRGKQVLWESGKSRKIPA